MRMFSAFIKICLKEFYIWVGKEASNADIQCLFGVPNYSSIPEDMVGLVLILLTLIFATS